MKRLALALVSSLALASSSFAWVGGPWSNNNYYGDQSGGTWQGVINGKGVTGFTFFGTNVTSDSFSGSLDPVTGIFGNSGVAIVFVDDEMIIGPSSHTSDIANRQLTGAFSGGVVTGVIDFVDQGLRFTQTLRISGYFVANINQLYPVIGYQGKGELTIKRASEPDISNDLKWTEEKDVVKIRATGARTSSIVPIFLNNFEEVFPGFEAIR